MVTTSSSSSSSLMSEAKRWEQLSGKNHWKGLLDPLDIDLRRSILHYGDMAEATYDAFNSEKASRNNGCCFYTRDDFFQKQGMSTSKNPFPYTVTTYFYATSGLPEFFYVKSNWMGYVAVATDEGKKVLGRRDIVVAWRGTVQRSEWFNDVDVRKTSAGEIFTGDDAPYVCRGWLDIYTTVDPDSKHNKNSAREQILSEIKRLVEKYKNEQVSITFTGHSLGAAVATLNAIDVVQNGHNKNFPVTAILFACPRVGDSKFLQLFNNLEKLRVLRIENKGDVVPDLPTNYSEVGERIGINSENSPYLKPGTIVGQHNLEVYLHGVTGFQGTKREFKLELNRDIALVNKSLDYLKAEYHVPESWWVMKNKGMVKGDDGHWKLIDHDL